MDAERHRATPADERGGWARWMGVRWVVGERGRRVVEIVGSAEGCWGGGGGGLRGV